MGVKAVILAAGKGTRMKSELPKVLHEAAGRPLVSWMLDTLVKAAVEDTAVVVGYRASEVAALLPAGVVAVEQTEQLGTGHAAAVGIGGLDLGDDDVVLVLPGDMPLITAETVSDLIETHRAAGASATVLTVHAPDPHGYGRVVRDHDGMVAAIVEHRDATPEQLAIDEVNTSVYAFSAAGLAELLQRIEPHNAQGEFYLTDAVALLNGDGKRVAAMATHAAEGLGVNSHAQLAEAASALRGRINRKWMEEGVAMTDPARVYLDADVELAPGVVIHPDTHVTGASVIGSGTSLGPSTFIADSNIGSDCRVWYSVLRSVEVASNVTIGPYASLRPGTRLGEGSKAGTFVEIKETDLGPGAKVPHLSYIGDASIGADANVGAGTITANYDGYQKHRTVIGDRVKIGSDNVLIAPVEIGDDAWTGAGSVISRDVSPGSLGVARSHQKEIEGYAERRRNRAKEKDQQ
ncbi:MAG: bifunctional UDP-N-acetylglucosamine diphosphorylase/glucosamine-1-phosphate N-acetyltransferase GlmU [Acidimicrobiia bacterium]|nr:bifunctional UDP-N-acetylglucosamine diphosphorylase/glucosamine-1-phosphate N-acetyltransferase GlmU [Acidimicrobiia bacterium]